MRALPVGQYRYDLGMATKRRVIGRNTTRLYPSGNRYDARELADHYKAVQKAAMEQPLDAVTSDRELQGPPERG